MVDVEDLMIFKLKAKGKKAAEAGAPQAEGVKGAPTVPVAETEHEAAIPRRRFFAFGIGKGKEKAAPAQQPKREARAAEAPAAAEQYIGKTVYAAQTRIGTVKISGVSSKEKEDVKGKFCEWHPWRPAYAICDYCHRPFCYEDTVELGKNYYCLEDIDQVSETYHEELYTKYNSVSLVAAGLFMLAFAVFVYFAGGQLIYIVGYAGTVGLPKFISTLNYSYGIALLGFVLTALSFVVAVLVVVRPNKGFVIGLLTGLSNIALFSYQFLNSGTFYMALISVMTFTALVLLAYSKVSYEAPEQSPYYNVGQQAGWPLNPSRF
jgi:hypothetical protein